MDFTPEQKEIVNAVTPHIDNLCDKTTKLDQTVGVVGFVFQPSTGLVMHFGNVKFGAPSAMLHLHQILAVAAIQADKVKSESPSISQGVSKEIREAMQDDLSEEQQSVFALADEMAKLVLMTPSDAPIPPELIVAAKTYIDSRVKV